MKKFIPFHELGETDAIIVDGQRQLGLKLSHWRGANTHPEIEADTSAEIVLNAIKKNYSGIDNQYISATHFDIDGFVGVWSLFYPELALKFEKILIEMAVIGDFRELDLNKEGAHEALKLVCWLNKVEKEKFYPPYGAESIGESEILMCNAKFNYFINAFSDVLLNIEKYKNDWVEEYNQVITDYNFIRKEQNSIIKYDEIGLVIVKTRVPLHYYALFSVTIGYDIVLSMYAENKYELEYKYTTWVDLTSRKTLPRIDMRKLADSLNEIEKSGRKWDYNKITDTGPILRLQGKNLSKEVRYDYPTKREIYSSSIAPEKLEQIVIDFFKSSFRNITPKKFWSWEEVKEIQIKIKEACQK